MAWVRSPPAGLPRNLLWWAAVISFSVYRMPDPRQEQDENTSTAEAVREVTGSEPVSGEDLLGSEDLRRQLREAKVREAGEKNR